MNHERAVIFKFWQVSLVIIIKIFYRVDIFECLGIQNLSHILRKRIVSHISQAAMIHAVDLIVFYGIDLVPAGTSCKGRESFLRLRFRNGKAHAHLIPSDLLRQILPPMNITLGFCEITYSLSKAI